MNGEVEQLLRSLRYRSRSAQTAVRSVFCVDSRVNTRFRSNAIVKKSSSESDGPNLLASAIMLRVEHLKKRKVIVRV